MNIITDFQTRNDDKKVELIQNIEFADVPGKWDLLYSVIDNRQEYDLARVEALKILEISDVPVSQVQRFCDLLTSVINTDPDYEVKNYAVIAARNFINDSETLKALLTRVVTNNDEDVDVRHNAYSAILRITDAAVKASVLQQLTTDNELGKYARKDI
jgi:HEAT repeat protein